MKKLVFKKLFKDIFSFFLMSTISLSVIIWIIQAVNFLDLISEDGHSLRVYFLFTLFSLPKIISKILPFIFMLSLTYTVIRYELNNELIIFWINGITKIDFINSVIKISLFYFSLQILFTTILVPYSLDKGRSYFRTSNVDLFTSIIKEKKFIDTVENLTIFIDKKQDNQLEKVLIKEKINKTDSQIIIAEKGNIINTQNSKKIILENGKIIKKEKLKQNVINFSKFSLDLNRYNSNTIMHPKTQEMSSYNLVTCIKKILINRDLSYSNNNIVFFTGCNLEISDSIFEEFLKRFFSPVFIILISLSSSLFILFNKDQQKFGLKSLFVFCFSVLIIIFSEVLLRYSSSGINTLSIYFLFPLFLFLIIYFTVFFKIKKISK